MSDAARLTAALADRYRIERELGAGGMATVFLAEDLRHRRQVALKVLLPELSASLGAERFLREIEVTANLQHPHILALYDSGQVDGSLFYVMPYVAGDTLRMRLKRDRQLPIGDAVRIARGVASALAFAHRQGVVHRDIKPENILLVEGEALVADFGIARAVAAAGGTTLTGTGITLGTPTYMSPEQAAADKQIDGRSDVYSLGCVLYEMLAGDPPYGGATAQVITARKLTEPLPSLRTVRSSISEEVEAIVLRALERAPADRFASADEMAAALDRAVSGAHATSYATRAQRRGAGWKQRAWQGAAIAGLALSAVLGWQAISGGSATPDAPPRRYAILLPDTLPMAFVGEAPSRIGRRAFALSPDGRTLVYSAWYRGRSHLAARSMDDDRVRLLEGTQGAYLPFFSPNGKWVAFVAENRLKKVSLDGGAPQQLTDVQGVHSGAWLPDGRILLGRDGQWPGFVSEQGGAITNLTTYCGFVAVPVAGTSLILCSGIQVAPWLRSMSDSTLIVEFGVDSARRRTLADLNDWGEIELRPSASPQVFGGDYLLVAGGGRLHARSVLSRTLDRVGPLLPLDEHPRIESDASTAHFLTAEDGTLLYAPGPDVQQGILVLADRTGRVDTLPFPSAAYQNVEYSPDGSLIAATVRTPTGMELLLLDPRNAESVLLHKSNSLFARPLWSARGDSLYFTVWGTGTRVVAAAGGAAPLVMPRVFQWARSRRDATSLVFSDSTKAFHLGAPSTPALRFLDAQAGVGGLALSPDGRRLVWAQEVAGGGVRYFASELPVRGDPPPVAPPGAVNCRWMPSGSELVCAFADQFLYSIPLTISGGTIRGGTPRRLTNVRVLDTPLFGWTLSPDGQKMLFVSSDHPDTTTRLTVVTNFRRVLEQRMAEVQGRAPRK